MATELKYYTQPDGLQFTALVQAIDIEKKAIVLDKTCFYPEGGGQPADRGSLDDVPVLNVQKKEDIVYHYIHDDNIEKFKIGSNIIGIVDPFFRMEYMQQHSGQHLISAVFFNELQCNTVGVHLGKDYTTIELDCPDISEEE